MLGQEALSEGPQSPGWGPHGYSQTPRDLQRNPVLLDMCSVNVGEQETESRFWVAHGRTSIQQEAGLLCEIAAATPGPTFHTPASACSTYQPCPTL